MAGRPVERGRGKVFPGWGAPPSLKNTENGVPDGFFLTQNMHAPPRIYPAGGAYDAPPGPIVGW